MALKTKKILTVLAAGVVSTAVLVACSTEETSQADGNSSSGEGKDGDNGAAITLTDIAGREVTLEEEPERIVLGEGRTLFATGILNT